MEQIRILWADDEMDLLTPYKIYLEEKGFLLTTVNNGNKALELYSNQNFDVVFLDESMPGLSGLETLARMKAIRQHVPVIMITKNEAESIMEDAIGSQIADYLIKPVNPNQILLALKKILDRPRLVSEKTNTAYQQELGKLGFEMQEAHDFKTWTEMYRKLVFWELELEKSKEQVMAEVLQQQKSEANRLFSKFISGNYFDWLHKPGSGPLLSHRLMKAKVFPLLDSSIPVFFVVIDNLRFDQWKVIQPILEEYFAPIEEEIFSSILPTATQYARNSIFAGLLPAEIAARYPKLWVNEEEDGGKNMHEEELLSEHLKRAGKAVKYSYAKITNTGSAASLSEGINNKFNNKLNVIVYNFVDALSHARTEIEVIKELAPDEAAYRSLTRSWILHSPLLDTLKKIGEKKCHLVIATDHGTIRVTKPTRIVGDRNTNTNLRYKTGKTLSYDKREVFEVKNPGDAFLPKSHLTASYAFALDDHYFVYPNNYNQFVTHFKDTFQHGGISMEEMLIPVITMQSRA